LSHALAHLVSVLVIFQLRSHTFCQDQPRTLLPMSLLYLGLCMCNPSMLSRALSKGLTNLFLVQTRLEPSSCLYLPTSWYYRLFFWKHNEQPVIKGLVWFPPSILVRVLDLKKKKSILVRVLDLKKKNHTQRKTKQSFYFGKNPKSFIKKISLV
jgi:hypothetical protein